MAKKQTGLLYPTNSYELQDALLNMGREFRKEESRANDQTSTRPATNGWTLDDKVALEGILNELNNRKAEALAIVEPVPGLAELMDCEAGEIGVIGPNRSGKTLSVLIRTAKILMGQWHIEGQFPKTDGVWAMVGPKLRHLRLFYYTLFKPGQFKMLKTDDGWKVPRYDNPDDVARISEWEPGPPLIPSRMVESISFEDVKEEIPSFIKLVNGWVIHFFSFESDPVQGVSWNGANFDEEAPRARLWLTETRARLMSRKGYLIWSATPENATATFYNFQARANHPDMAKKIPYKQTKFFKLTRETPNPYIDPIAREALVERLTEDDPDAAIAKIDGEYAYKKYLVYQEFDRNKHIIPAFDIDWRDTVYVMLDPSRTRMAIMLCVLVHPESPHYLPEQPDRIIAFDEIVIKNCTAFKAARALNEKINVHYKHWIEYILIDWQQGRKTDDSQTQVAEYYWNEFSTIGIKPRVNHFVHGASGVEAGIETVAQHLEPKDRKPPKFVIMEGKCPMTVWEFERYYRIKNPDLTPGKPHQRLNDLVDCARYACSAGLTWVMPPVMAPQSTHYSAEELRAIDRNPRLWHYTMMYGDPKKRPQRIR